jgi:hypothetical protein
MGLTSDRISPRCSITSHEATFGMSGQYSPYLTPVSFFPRWEEDDVGNGHFTTAIFLTAVNDPAVILYMYTPLARVLASKAT